MTNLTRPIALDCSRCMVAEGCPYEQTCRRNSAVPQGAYRSVWSTFEGGEGCDGYLQEKTP